MAVITHHTQEQRDNIAARIGRLFDLPDAGMKMTREGWSMDGWGDEIKLTIELVTFISKEEAQAILNAKPVEESNDGRQ